MRQLSKFYGVPVRVEGIDEPAFISGRNSLLFREHSREFVWQGLRVVMGFPLREGRGEHWVSRLDLAHTLEPALRPQFVQPLEVPRTIILDPGHGGHDRGAHSFYQYEKNFTLDLARRLRGRLKAKGWAVVLTRNADVFVELEERARMAERYPSPIFLSLHFNAAANPAAQGFEIFSLAPRGAPSSSSEDLKVSDMVPAEGQAWELPSFVLGQTVYHAMHGRVSMADRGMKRARFAVLRYAKCPSVLIEGGFLSHSLDARRIASPAWRDRLAEAIAEGVAAYANFTSTRKPPPIAADYRVGARTSVRLSLPPPSPAPSPTAPTLRLRDIPMPGH